MRTYKFSRTAVTLNQLLTACGIETKKIDGKNYLVYNSIWVPRPPHDKVEEVLKKHFDITIKYID